jgi:hypothetical protein
VTPCPVEVGYQGFGGPYCLHLKGEVVFWVVTPCSDVVRYEGFCYETAP